MVGSIQRLKKPCGEIEEDCPQKTECHLQQKNSGCYLSEKLANDLSKTEICKNWPSNRHLLEICTESKENNLVRVIRDSKKQRILEINLDETGIESSHLDRLKPRIVVREKSRCHKESQATYALTVRIWKVGEEFVPNEFPFGRVRISTKYWHAGEDTEDWETSEVVFDKYPSGIRRIVIESESRLWNKSSHDVEFGETQVFLDFEKKRAAPKIPTSNEPAEKPMIFFV